MSECKDNCNNKVILTSPAPPAMDDLPLPKADQPTETSCDAKAAPSGTISVHPVDTPNIKSMGTITSQPATIMQMKELDASCDEPEEPAEEPCDDAPLEPTCINPCTVTETTETAKCFDCSYSYTTTVTKARLMLLDENNCLASLEGEGFVVQDADGNVSLDGNPKLNVTNLWHYWVQTGPNTPPILGEPRPAPYRLVADADGCAYATRGLSTEPSISVWNPVTEMMEEIGVTQFPQCVSDHVPSALSLEVTGYRPLGANEPLDTVRCLEKLCGEGPVILKKVETASSPTDDCDPVPTEPTYTYVLEAIPTDPCATGPKILACIDGQWAAVDPSAIEGLQGPAGEAGAAGDPGPKGDQGEKGDQGISNCNCE